MTSQPTHQATRGESEQVKIQQQNVNKSLIVQSNLLDQLDPNLFNICTIQEPYLDHNHNSCPTPHWYTIYLKEHYVSLSKTRSLMLVSKCIVTDTWSQVDSGSSDIMAIQVCTRLSKILIVNMYSDNVWQEGIKQVAQVLKARTSRGRAVGWNHHTIWLRDFNVHHPMWDEGWNSHLFSPANLSRPRC